MKYLRTPVLCCLLLSMFFAQGVSAQETQRHGYRKWIMAAAGAVVTGGVAAFAGSGAEGSVCASRTCQMSVGAAIGAAGGFLLGADMDDAAALRRDLGPRLAWAPAERSIGATPFRMVGPRGAGLVTTSTGLRHLPDQGAARAILSGVQVTDATVTPQAAGAALAATSIGLLRAPLAGDADPDTLDRDLISALAITADGALVLGGRGLLRRATLARGGVDESARATVSGMPTSLYVTRAGTVWMVSGNVLAAHDATSLQPLGQAALPGSAMSFGTDEDERLAAVALGADGVALVDISDPRQPRVVGRIQRMSSAASAALAGGRAYVAGGNQGLFVFDIANPAAPQAIGVVADLGFVADVRVADGVITVLDRSGQRLLTGRADAITPR